MFLILLAATAPCSAPELHALDFWEGSWNVQDRQTGSFDGDDVVAKMLGGCALRESWTDASGERGESVFWFDASSKRWKQVWVTSAGGVSVVVVEQASGNQAQLVLPSAILMKMRLTPMLFSLSASCAWV